MKQVFQNRLLMLALLAVFLVPATAWPQTGDTVWVSVADSGSTSVHLYFFWSKKCPHCRKALPFVENLAGKNTWLVLHSLELTEHPDHVKQYSAMAAMLEQDARSVPAFFWCGKMVTGYDSERGIGAFLEKELQSCRDSFRSESRELQASSTGTSMSVPLLGNIDEQRYSLPVYTVVLAAMDAFNPCAFFVLLFLLSLLVNARSRFRMLLIGGIFVLFSGILYFLFMTAWLNVFLLIGRIDMITTIAGIVAAAIALINIKDYFWFKQGATLSIPGSARPGLFQRMRATVQASSLNAMIVATIGLAGFANMYEFLCTAGFPMVYTRILTMNDLSTATYYLYLLLYNVVYVVPLIIIVALFVITLGSRKLSEKQGRELKLISGVMMMLLGGVLIVNSEWLNRAGIAVLMLVVALLLSGLIMAFDRHAGKHSGRH